jgi:hypothetical protein
MNPTPPEQEYIPPEYAHLFDTTQEGAAAPKVEQPKVETRPSMENKPWSDVLSAAGSNFLGDMGSTIRGLATAPFQLVSALGTVLSDPKSTLRKRLDITSPISPADIGGDIQSAADTFLSKYYPSNFKNTIAYNPTSPVMDLASTALPMLRGVKGTGAALEGTVNAINPKNRILSHFLPEGFGDVQAWLPKLGVDPTTVAKTMDWAKENLGIDLSAAQLVANPRASMLESIAPGTEKRVLDQLERGRQFLYNQYQETRNKTMVSNPKGVGNPLLNTPEDMANIVQKAFAPEYKEQAGALAQQSKSVGKLANVNSAEDISALTAEDRKALFKDNPDVRSEYNKYLKNKANFDQSAKLKPALDLAHGKLRSVSSVNPPDTFWVNADPSNAVKYAVQSKENMARFLTLPGVTQEHGQMAIMQKVIQDSTTAEGKLVPSKLISSLADNGDVLRQVYTGDEGGRVRAGLQSLAHTMDMVNRSGNTENMAARFVSGTNNANLQIGGALAEAPIAKGQIAKMRFSYGAVRRLTATVESKFVAPLLSNPDAVWLTQRLAATPVGSPSFMTNMKAFVKVCGQLNIPLKLESGGDRFDVNNKTGITPMKTGLKVTPSSSEEDYVPPEYNHLFSTESPQKQ